MCLEDKSGDVGDVEYMQCRRQASIRQQPHHPLKVTSDAVDSPQLPLANAMRIPERDLSLYSE
jgi:hypothetical protein